MRFSKWVGVLAVLLLAAMAHPAWADTIYATSFENPPFTTGTIAGQNGWEIYGSPNADIEDSYAYSGSQAVFVGPATSQSGPFYTLSTDGPIVDVNVELAIFTATTETTWQFGVTGPGDVGYLGGVNLVPEDSDLGATDEVEAISGSFPNVGTFNLSTGFNPVTWNDLDLLFNLNTQTYNITLDGNLLASDLPFCGTNIGCTGGSISSVGEVIFDTFGNPDGIENDSAYMDNISISTPSPTPEPSTALPLAGILAAAIALRLRRARA